MERRKYETLKEQLLDKIEIDPDTQCWNWTGALNADGYGQTAWRGQWMVAHRFSYQEFVGPLEKGKVICHECHNRKCLNPDHLTQETQKYNLNDPVTKLKSSVARKHRKSSGSYVHHRIEVNGKQMTVPKFAKAFGMPEAWVRMRVKQKWNYDDLIDGHQKKHQKNSDEKNSDQWRHRNKEKEEEEKPIPCFDEGPCDSGQPDSDQSPT